MTDFVSDIIQNFPYGASLWLTILAEAVVTAIFTKKFKYILFCLLINIITHPWAYYFYEKNIDFLLIETAVILVECVMWLKIFGLKRRAMMLAVSTNACSASIGVLLTRIIG